jgi:hypothetical protein
MKDEEVLAFLTASIRSIWTLELLLLLRRQRERAWQAGVLVQELRASANVVQLGLASLAGAGFVAVDEQGGTQYQPLSPQLEALADAVAALYATRPVTVINAIAAPSDDKLRIFSESFRLKE